MDTNYVIQDVPIEIALHVARIVNISPAPLEKNAIITGMEQIAKKSYTERGINLALQFGMIESSTGNNFQYSPKFKEDFLKVHKDDFSIIARKALQDFPPFLLFIENLRIGYSVKESASMISGIFNMKKGVVEKFFAKSGLFCGMLENKNEEIKLSKPYVGQIDYIKNLKSSLDSDLEAKNFITMLLSKEIVAYFSGKGIDFNRPAKALIEIKSDPKASLSKIFEFAELCLYSFGDDLGANVKSANGISELIDVIRGQNGILTKPTNLGKGLGALRNMTNHGPDKETGKTWNFTEETALGASLIVFRFLRSMYLQHYTKQQEI